MKFNNKYQPVAEDGSFSDKEFDIRFSFDRTYNYQSKFFFHRFRIVKYPDHDLYTVYYLRLLTIFSFKKIIPTFKKNFLIKFIDNLFEICQKFEYSKDEILTNFNYKI